jgi:hypothetical protein
MVGKALLFSGLGARLRMCLSSGWRRRFWNGAVDAHFLFGASPSARLRFGLVAAALRIGVGINFLCAHAREILEFRYGMRIEGPREGIELWV